MANIDKSYAIPGGGIQEADPNEFQPGTIDSANTPSGQLGLQFSAEDGPNGHKAGPREMTLLQGVNQVEGIITEARSELGIGDYMTDPSAKRWGLGATGNVHGVIAVLALLSSITAMTTAVIVELKEEPPKKLEYQPVELVTLRNLAKGRPGANGAEGAKRSQAKPDFKPPSKGMPIDARVDDSAPDFIPKPKDPKQPKVRTGTVGASSDVDIKRLGRSNGGFGPDLHGQGAGAGVGGQGLGRIGGFVDTGEGKTGESLKCMGITRVDCGTPPTALGKSCPETCAQINSIK